MLDSGDKVSFNILLMRLEGPLQSWGLRSQWDERDTSLIPSKSGIIGLLACALGYKRNDKNIELELSEQLKIGIRIDKQGKIIKDFHTILGRPFTIADGKHDDRTIVSNRYFIEDGSFLVAIAGEKDLLEKLKKALCNPVWPLYLGRKSCIPTKPIFDKLTNQYNKFEEAFEQEYWENFFEDEEKEYLMSYIEDEKGTFSQPDAIKVTPVRLYGTTNYIPQKIKLKVN